MHSKVYKQVRCSYSEARTISDSWRAEVKPQLFCDNYKHLPILWQSAETPLQFFSLTARWTSRWWTACGSNAQTSSHWATRSQKRTALQLCHVKPAHISHRFCKVTGFRRVCENQVKIPYYLLIDITSIFTHSHGPLFHNFLFTPGLSLWKMFLFSNYIFKHRLSFLHYFGRHNCSPMEGKQLSTCSTWWGSDLVGKHCNITKIHTDE